MHGLVFLYEGFEEIEASTIIDILRRAGLAITVTGTSAIIIGGQSMKIVVDAKISDINTDDYDFIALPGGPGYRSILDSTDVHEMLRSFNEKGKLIAAICAAPLILQKAGVLDGKKATAYPGMEKYLDNPREESVVVDQNIVTSRGPGTAIEFSLKIVEMMIGKTASDNLRKDLVYE
ncbi:MAG: DJ-1 family glyoxalase III [Candidatus Aenigmatarchaeota archaeon]